eukprot:jgi/Galph1/944/GphlegSOOS_G5596.1
MNLSQNSFTSPAPTHETSYSCTPSSTDIQSSPYEVDVTSSLEILTETNPEVYCENSTALRTALKTIRKACRRKEEDNKERRTDQEEWSITQDIIVCLPRLSASIKQHFLQNQSSTQLKLEGYHTIYEISRLLIKEEYEFEEVFHIWRQRLLPTVFEDAACGDHSLATVALKVLLLLIPDINYSKGCDPETQRCIERSCNFPKTQQENFRIIRQRISVLEEIDDSFLRKRLSTLLSLWNDSHFSELHRHDTDKNLEKISPSHSQVVPCSDNHSSTKSNVEEYDGQRDEASDIFHTPSSTKYSDDSRITRSTKKDLDSDGFVWITHNQAEVIERFATSVRRHAEIVTRMSNIGCLDTENTCNKGVTGIQLQENHVNDGDGKENIEINKENQCNAKEKSDMVERDIKALREQVTRKALEEAGIVIEEYQNLINKYQSEFRAKMELEHIIHQYEATLRKTISQSRSQVNMRLIELETENRKLKADLMSMKRNPSEHLKFNNVENSKENTREQTELSKKQKETIDTLQRDLSNLEKAHYLLKSDAETKLSQAFKQVSLYREEYLKQCSSIDNLQDECSKLKKLVNEKSSEVFLLQQEKQKLNDENVKLKAVNSEQTQKVEYTETQLEHWKRQYEEKSSVVLELTAQSQVLQAAKTRYEETEKELYDTRKKLEEIQRAFEESNEENKKLKVRIYDASQELQSLKDVAGKRQNVTSGERDPVVERLERQLCTKTRENEQLSELCEELVGKLEFYENRFSRNEVVPNQ